jgi:hypothetical protein
MSKLTLSVDDAVVSRAKRYAKRQGVSVSQMVEAYLAAVSESGAPAPRDFPPILRSLRGSLQRGDLETYRKHLAVKYK